MDAGAEGFPSEPGAGAEAEDVNEVVVFKPCSDEPEGIKDGVFAVVAPVFREVNEAAGEVEGTPDGEAPEGHVGEVDSRVKKDHEPGCDKKEGDVETEEFPVVLSDGGADGSDEVKRDD